jgi:hypothetical protein
MTDAHTIRQQAGEFDYLPPLVLRSEDELVAYLDDWAGSPDWHGDSLLGPDGYEIAVCCERPTDWRRVADLLSYIWQRPATSATRWKFAPRTSPARTPSYATSSPAPKHRPVR